MNKHNMWIKLKKKKKRDAHELESTVSRQKNDSIFLPINIVHPREKCQPWTGLVSATRIQKKLISTWTSYHED